MLGDESKCGHLNSSPTTMEINLAGTKWALAIMENESRVQSVDHGHPDMEKGPQKNDKMFKEILCFPLLFPTPTSLLMEIAWKSFGKTFGSLFGAAQPRLQKVMIYFASLKSTRKISS